MPFKILMYHEPEDILKEAFAGSDIQIKFGTQPTEAAMCADIADCDALVLFEQPENGFNRKIIEAAKQLKLIARFGAGYETVDVDCASEDGIYVSNTPRVNNISVAEGILAMMVGCNRNTQKVVERFRRLKGDYPFFNSDSSARGHDLYGKTLGLVGCGSIGQTVAEMAVFGLHMKVIGYDPYLKDFPAHIEKMDSRDQVFQNADYVSLHLPSMESTRRSVGMSDFQMMKPTAYFINAARGNIVREEELICALRNKVITGAALDVYAQEPIAQSSYELFDLDHVYLLPHCTAFTVESHERGLRSMAQSLVEAANGQKPTFRVNEPVNPRLFKK